MSFHGFICNNLYNRITEDVIYSKWVRGIYIKRSTNYSTKIEPSEISFIPSYDYVNQ